MTGQQQTGVEGLGVVVVGALTGSLGSSIADGLEARGARVVRTTTRDTAASGAGVVHMDVTDEESVERGFAGALEELGRLDAVVNASGITAQAPAVETPLSAWNRVLEVNLTGSFLVCQAAARIMLIQDSTPYGRGSIVLVSSLCAAVGCDEVPAYAAAKSGVSGLARSLASEWGPHGIRVNTVDPGVFLTPLNAARVQGTQRGANSLHRTPLGRFGRAEELQGAIALLAGRDGSFMTGTAVTVDGGFRASGIHERPALPAPAAVTP